MKPELSTIICTHNRSDLLSDTLNSYSTMAQKAEVNAELIIIDNNSTDDTAHIARQFVAGRTDARYFFEAKTGLSHARNTGIAEASSEVIAFVDDDVYFDQGWLNAVIRAFTARPEVDCVGGKTLPHFESGTPPWLHRTMMYMYGTTNTGESESWMEFPKHPFGVNMAFRKKVFQRIGLFDPRLGRIGDSLLSGEEADVFRRVYLAGFNTLYIPDAIIHHRIPDSRTKPDWVLQRSYWQGISEVVFRQLHDPMSRLELLSLALSDALWILHHHTGGHRNPRRILWHHKGLPLHARTWSELRQGRIRQALKEVLLGSTRSFSSQISTNETVEKEG